MARKGRTFILALLAITAVIATAEDVEAPSELSTSERIVDEAFGGADSAAAAMSDLDLRAQRQKEAREAREYYQQLREAQQRREAEAMKAYTESSGITLARELAARERRELLGRKQRRRASLERAQGALPRTPEAAPVQADGNRNLVAEKADLERQEASQPSHSMPIAGMASGGVANRGRQHAAGARAAGLSTSGVSNAAEATVDSAARSLSAVNRFFSWLEGGSRETPGECPPNQQKHALTALLLAIMVPPACQYYYGYAVLASVQLVLYLLCLTPLCFACGWFWRPTPKKTANMTLLDSWQPALDSVSTGSRWLFGLLVASCVIFVVLLCWQITLIVRVSTGAYLPSDGCPVVPL